RSPDGRAGEVWWSSPLGRHGRVPMPAYADPTPTPISADTIFLAFELSGTSWLVALHAPDADKVERHRLSAGVAAEGIASHVMDPTSLQVDRRARRAKTDRLDAQALLRALMAWSRGERQVCSM